MRHSHTMKYHAAIKRNEVLLYATIWMRIENIMLNERIQAQKNHIFYDSMYVKCPE